MAFVGFTRHVQRNGAWFPRIGLSGGGTKYAPLVIQSQSTPPTDTTAGSMYVNSSGQLVVSNGTSYVAGGADIVQTLPLIDAVDRSIIIAPRGLQLVSLEVVYSVAAGGALTLDLKKCTGTTAPASGTTMLSGTVNLNTTVNTVITAGLSATAADTKLADGDRAAWDFTGSVGTLVGSATVVWRPIS